MRSMSEQHHGRTRPEAPSELTDPLAGVLGVTRRRRRGASAQAEESEPLPRPRRQDLSDDGVARSSSSSPSIGSATFPS